MPAALLHVDSRKRITLPSESKIHSGEDLELEVLEDGRILLTPIVRIPRHQLWQFSPEVDAIVSKAEKDQSTRHEFSSPESVDALLADLLS